MEINGREIRFLRTVRANCDIADMCAGRDLGNLKTLLFEGAYSKQQFARARFIAALSAGYEAAQRFTDPTHEENPISAEEAMALLPEDFEQLSIEALEAFTGGGKRSVEASPVKQKKTDREKEKKSD